MTNDDLVMMLTALDLIVLRARDKVPKHATGYTIFAALATEIEIMLEERKQYASDKSSEA